MLRLFRFPIGKPVKLELGTQREAGAVGLEGLVIYKWKLLGSGQVVEDYSGTDAKKFMHRELTAEDAG